MNIDNNTILVTNNINRTILSVRDSSKFLNVKFMTLNDLRNNYYFFYDKKTIFYLMNKYNYDYDVCIEHLNNLYYVNDKLNNDKVNFLINLRKELDNNNLLIYNDLFKDYLRDKNIIIYNYNLSKCDYILINELKNIYNITIYNDATSKYDNKSIYEFDTIEEEIDYVSSKIVELIDSGVSINDIKICGYSEEYKNIIKRVFGLYKIPIIFNDNYLYNTAIGKDFLDNLSSNVIDTLNYIENKYDLNDNNIRDLYNSIISIVNDYVWCNNYLDVKKMIIHDFKNKIVNEINYSNEVNIINSLEGYYDKYIYLINFSQGIIPKIYKDEDYFSDKEKSVLGIDTSEELNGLNYNKWYKDILACKNLFISYKKHSSLGDFYLSSLNDDLNFCVIKDKSNYNYSNLYNKIKLTNCIDNLIKYNAINNDISLLYNNYNDIKYMDYDNRFTYINKDKLKSYLNNKLVLSYSAINNYYHCSFKYYLSNILRLNIFDDSFYIIIDNLFHYMLSICFDSDIDMHNEYSDYIKKLDYKFNDRELFFLDNLFEELVFIIETIKKQYSYSSLTNYLYEDNIEIDKSKNDMLIIFKGFIDKIIMDNDKKIAAIVDYKTGNPNLDLSNSIYGLDLQLPVYVYLTKYKFPNIRIVGFYLQKILNNEIIRTDKDDYIKLKEDKLKLQGYTNSDIDIINLFDSSYNDSKVIRGMKTSSKGITSKKILDDTMISNLCKLTDDKIDNAIDNIMNANFDINPKRIGNDNVGCLYCKYKDICFMKDKDIIYLDDNKDLDFIRNY